MDIQRAIKRVQRARSLAAEAGVKEAVEDLSVALEALEKEVPKRVTKRDIKVKALDVETEQILTFICGKCPNCTKWISQNNNHCPHCGQKVSWEEEDD